MYSNDGNKVWSIINNNNTDKFKVEKVEVKTNYKITSNNIFYTLIVIEGNGKLKYTNDEVSLKKGDIIFMPANIAECEIINHDFIKLIKCSPPSAYLN